MPPIPVNLAMEDALSEVVLTRLLQASGKDYATSTVYSRGGYGYLKKTINGFNHAAKGIPFIVLTDLDQYECPQALIADWLTAPKRENLLLRVAVTEVESWLLCDREGVAAFLGVKVDVIPDNPEELADPKKVLVSIACKSPKREIRDDICPRKGSTSRVGPNYNGRLSEFVLNHWSVDAARLRGQSLARTLSRLEDFVPTWAAEKGD